MNSSTTKRVLILGGGFAGLYAAMELEKVMARDPNLEVTVINRENFFLFTPMLHEVAASDLDITLIASASLLQGQVAKNLPEFVAQALGLENDAERALQFVRSSPGITTALVGMARAEHAKANARLVGVAPATLDEFSKLFSRGEGA